MRRKAKNLCMLHASALSILLLSFTAVKAKSFVDDSHVLSRIRVECITDGVDADDARSRVAFESVKVASSGVIMHIPQYKFTDRERYELAKIAMCESEVESADTKALIMFVVLNRVKDEEFPDNIHDVIFEEHNGTYQFTPTIEGHRWSYVEPDQECYDIVDAIASGEVKNHSDGALYFEASASSDNWHSRNLEYLFKSDQTRFYK